MRATGPRKEGRRSSRQSSTGTILVMALLRLDKLSEVWKTTDCRGRGHSPWAEITAQVTWLCPGIFTIQQWVDAMSSLSPVSFLKVTRQLTPSVPMWFCGQ